MWPFPYHRRLYIRIIVHVVFWLAYLVVNALTLKRFYPDEAFIQILLRISFTWPVDIIATYLTAFYLLPKFIYTRRFLAFFALFIPSAIGLIISQRLILQYLEYPLFFPDNVLPPFWRFNWIYTFTNIFIVPFGVSLVKLFQLMLKQQQETQILGKERIEAELKFLKAQVHPHFLFNTLNNLYALSLDKSEKTPEVVLKLSDLLNYMLYECNEPTILFSKEIRLLENYLELESMRYGSQLNLSFDVSGDITGKRIAPMLLLPFVENAFKHGVSKVSKEAKVFITLDVLENELTFKVENSKPAKSDPDPSGYTEGIGLQNVKRRLDLLYHDRYTLQVRENDEEYYVYLNINLEQKS